MSLRLNKSGTSWRTSSSSWSPQWPTATSRSEALPRNPLWRFVNWCDANSMPSTICSLSYWSVWRAQTNRLRAQRFAVWYSPSSRTYSTRIANWIEAPTPPSQERKGSQRKRTWRTMTTKPTSLKMMKIMKMTPIRTSYHRMIRHSNNSSWKPQGSFLFSSKIGTRGTSWRDQCSFSWNFRAICLPVSHFRAKWHSSLSRLSSHRGHRIIWRFSSTDFCFEELLRSSWRDVALRPWPAWCQKLIERS